MIGRVISLFPSSFSTLLLAYEKTNFVEYIHGVRMVGSTVFVPSNTAFARLGIRANAFLFNTETGLKYLKAILKYHIAPNATLYTDAFYDKTGEGESGDVDAQETQHFDLTTLLDKAHVGVDIATTFAGFSTIRVNGFSHVTIADGLGKNGAIHVLDKVLIPPCKHHKHGEDRDDDDEDAFITGEMDIAELKERLAGYVE